jgi:hypothetical protein
MGAARFAICGMTTDERTCIRVTPATNDHRMPSLVVPGVLAARTDPSSGAGINADRWSVVAPFGRGRFDRLPPPLTVTGDGDRQQISMTHIAWRAGELVALSGSQR